MNRQTYAKRNSSFTPKFYATKTSLLFYFLFFYRRLLASCSGATYGPASPSLGSGVASELRRVQMRWCPVCVDALYDALYGLYMASLASLAHIYT